MRRSSSKKKSQRSAAAAAAAAAAGTICELDDSALERHVGIVEDDVAIDESPSALPSAEVCENASLRQLFYFPLLCGWEKFPFRPLQPVQRLMEERELLLLSLSLSSIQSNVGREVVECLLFPLRGEHHADGLKRIRRRICVEEGRACAIFSPSKLFSQRCRRQVLPLYNQAHTYIYVSRRALQGERERVSTTKPLTWWNLNDPIAWALAASRAYIQWRMWGGFAAGWCILKADEIQHTQQQQKQQPKRGKKGGINGDSNEGGNPRDATGAPQNLTHRLFFILFFFHRLKCLLRLLDKGEVRPEVVQKNLKLAIQVLDSVYVDEAGRWAASAPFCFKFIAQVAYDSNKNKKKDIAIIRLLKVTCGARLIDAASAAPSRSIELAAQQKRLMWPQVFLRIREEARGAEIITKYITAQSTNVAVQSYNPFRHRYPVGINRNCGKDKTHQQNKKRNTKKKTVFFLLRFAQLASPSA